MTSSTIIFILYIRFYVFAKYTRDDEEVFTFAFLEYKMLQYLIVVDVKISLILDTFVKKTNKERKKERKSNHIYMDIKIECVFW